MALKSVFIPNPLGILEAFRQPLMLGAMLTVAEEIKAVAQGIAPMDQDDDVWGHYRDRLVATTEIWPPGLGIAKGAVLAIKPTSGWIEFGTVDTPRFAPLRRAAESVAGPVIGGKGGVV